LVSPPAGLPPNAPLPAVEVAPAVPVIPPIVVSPPAVAPPELVVPPLAAAPPELVVPPPSVAPAELVLPPFAGAPPKLVVPALTPPELVMPPLAVAPAEVVVPPLSPPLLGPVQSGRINNKAAPNEMALALMGFGSCKVGDEPDAASRGSAKPTLRSSTPDGLLSRLQRKPPSGPPVDVGRYLYVSTTSTRVTIYESVAEPG